MCRIASFEITDIPLIEYAAAKGKPMIISTGIADAGDIHAAVDACQRVGNNEITLLQCTSSYPAPVELANLRMIPKLAERGEEGTKRMNIFPHGQLSAHKRDAWRMHEQQTH